jgi:hypothetical protein
MHIIVRQCKLSDDQAIRASYLQLVFEVARVHFKADGHVPSIQHSLEHAVTSLHQPLSHIYFEPCHKIFDSAGSAAR